MAREGQADQAGARIAGATARPELVVALVSAIGTDMEGVETALQEAFGRVGYHTSDVRLSELLDQLVPFQNLAHVEEDQRYAEHMTAGTSLRNQLTRGDALAILAVGAIREIRQSQGGSPNESLDEWAYILRSLKHPDEVGTLRRLYGPGLLVVSAYCPREKRLSDLATRIARSRHAFQSDQYRADAEILVQRDLAERDEPFGQNVRDTFPLGDVFVDASDPGGLRGATNRFVELVFSNTFHTPNRDEYGMFHARAAALRSASLARQVGSVVATSQGDIVAVGANEVPRAGGGLYWPGDPDDARDFNLGEDSSDVMRRALVTDVIHRMRDAGWLSEERMNQSVENLVEEALRRGAGSLMSGSHVMNIIEFNRAVHAEMAALVDAARRGVSVAGNTLYSSTFPCHDCAKHIVAAGIKRVVYIEPYPKSLAPDLYLDSISVDGEQPDVVSFEPFVGVAPVRYMELFEMTQRKEVGGKVRVWDPHGASVRVSPPPAYIAAEQSVLVELRERMAEVGIQAKENGGGS
jgi:deoxycytidylate deaminase